MSEYKFNCPYCAQHLSASTEWAGRMVPCPNCQKEFPAPGAPAAAAPPALPAATGLRVADASQRTSSSDGPPVITAQSDLEQKVLAGGRFVIFHYCFSVLVMSFKRTSGVTYVPPGEDGVGGAVSHSLISLLVVWWGIPWGPIWTISTVYRNARGGTDVTQAVLTEQLGPGRAAQILAQRRMVPPGGWGLKAFRWGLGGAAALVLLFIILPFIMMIVMPRSDGGDEPRAASRSAARAEARGRADLPGQAEFLAANRQLGVNRGPIAFGNSAPATAVATEFSGRMKRLREEQFEGGKKNGFSASGHEFLTHCELQDGKCAIIVHVPELRRYNTEAKTALGNLAWQSAQAALQKQGVARPGMNLAVGLRGIALFDRVLVGKVAASAMPGDNGLRNTTTGSQSDQELYSYFQPTPRTVPAAKPQSGATPGKPL